MLWQVSFAALQRAELTRHKLPSSSTGVFAGLSVGENFALPPRAQPGPYTATGNHAAIASNRLSFVLGLEGPSMSVDTACSSSIVAIDVARQSLLSDACRTAVCSGVNVMLSPYGFIVTCRAHMLSTTSRCKTFDISADGYGRSEGCCAVVIRAASQQEHQCTLHGTGVNQDGQTASLTSPNGLCQQKVITRSLVQSGMHANDMWMIECHGTGTALGDPIEIAAQRTVLGAHQNSKSPLTTSAAKSSVGHLEAGAGMVGLFKAVLSLQVNERLPNQCLRKLNPYVDMASYQTLLPTEVGSRNNAESQTRAIGISTFGFGGTNAHATIRWSPSHICPLLPVRETASVIYQSTPFAWWSGGEEHRKAATSPMLGPLIPVDDNTCKIWERCWTQFICKYTAGHRVGWTPLAPGTGFLQMAKTAVLTGDQDVDLTGVHFLAILFLDVAGKGTIPTLRVKLQQRLNSVSVESRTFPDDWLEHVNMLGTAVDALPIGQPCTLLLSDKFCADGAQFYQSTGNDYRQDFRSVQTVWLCHHTNNADTSLVVIGRVASESANPAQQVAS